MIDAGQEMEWPKRYDGIPVFGEPSDKETLAQAKHCLVDSRAMHSVLMADNHRGYSQPIGGVVAYDNAVSPSGVGYDIGCGNNALRTFFDIEQLGYSSPILAATPEGGLYEKRTRTNDVMKWIMDAIWEHVNFGMGSKSDLGKDHPIFDDPRWSVNSYVQELRELARAQIGSVGSGNHYVDLFYDETGTVWIGNHFGSRGFGRKTATGFMNLAHGRPWKGHVQDSMDALPTVLSLDTELGQEYWAAMELAGEYALVGRDLVLYQVHNILSQIISGQELTHWSYFTPEPYEPDKDLGEIVRNNHNLAWREQHADQELIVVRKGATPAWPGQLGFVGGSMGDNAVIIRGSNSASKAQAAALYSTVHGAGRVMSRRKAAGKLNYKTGHRAGGDITPEMMYDWIAQRGVMLRGAGTDEAPQAYKRLPDVLQAQGDTIEIIHELTPIGVAMAGPDIKDAYKD